MVVADYNVSLVSWVDGVDGKERFRVASSSAIVGTSATITVLL